MLRCRVLLSFLAACSSKAAAPAAGNDGSAAAPAAAPAFTRGEIDCAGVIRGSEGAIGGAIAPGWGAIPKALQIVPPGGELCGHGTINGHAAAFIRSPLFGQALADLYAPTGPECTIKVDVNGNDRVQVSIASMTCDGHPRLVAVTDSTYGFYTLQVF